ncbi:MAG: hypothetical protein U0271_34210 [Polyangiaceae bacterium]
MTEPRLNRELGFSSKSEPRRERVPQVVERQRASLGIIGEELVSVELGKPHMVAQRRRHVVEAREVDQRIGLRATTDQGGEQRPQRELDRHAARAAPLGSLLAPGDAVASLGDAEVTAIEHDVGDAQHGQFSEP